jgi:hypothetical protein
MASDAKRGAAGVLGLLVIIAGVILVVAGGTAYAVVSKTLGDQNITVSDDAAHFGGQHITQPWQAYAQANVIDKHVKKITGGKTYAELPQDDPNRDTAMTASFLQASLFTSVVAFGVAAMAAGLGVVLILIGWALRSLASRAIGIAPVAPAPEPVAVAAAPAPVSEPVATRSATAEPPAEEAPPPAERAAAERAAAERAAAEPPTAPPTEPPAAEPSAPTTPPG